MKLSFGRASTFVLALGSIIVGATSACADSEVIGEVTPMPDSGPSIVPDSGPDDAAAPPVVVPEASVEAGPKTCSDHGFCPTSVPDGQTVKALWGDGAGVVWAATQEGKILRWDGNAWNVHASDLGPLAAIWGSSSTDVWVGGEEGLQHGTGASPETLTFTPVTLPADTSPIQSIWGVSAGDIWAVGTGLDMSTFDYVGRAFHFTGAQWEELLPEEFDPDLERGVRFTRVWGSAAGGVWLGGGRPIVDTPWVMELVLLHKIGDEDFTQTVLPVDPDPQVMDYEKESAITGAVVSGKTSLTIFGQPIPLFSRPSVWRGTSTDDGKTFTFTWAQDERSPNPAVQTVFGTASNDVWAAGDYGRLMHSNGVKWSTTAISVTGLPVKDPFFSVWANGSSEIWVGGKGMALRFDPTKEIDGGVE